MKDFSKETINIAGKDYTLFLNRKGIVAWEKYAKEENKQLENFKSKYSNFISEDEVVINDDTNPFEDLNLDDIDKDKEITTNSYKKLYWIMLYENHKLSLKEASDLYDKAVDDYGEQQLVDLAVQMITDANKDQLEKTEIKKLPALKPRQ